MRLIKCPGEPARPAERPPARDCAQSLIPGIARGEGANEGPPEEGTAPRMGETEGLLLEDGVVTGSTLGDWFAEAELEVSDAGPRVFPVLEHMLDVLVVVVRWGMGPRGGMTHVNFPDACLVTAATTPPASFASFLAFFAPGGKSS